MQDRWGAVAGAALATLAPAAARADEPMFGYVNTTDLLPRGKFQVEQQLTLRSGQAGGRYRRIEARTETDYGLRDDLQLTGYLNYSYVDASRNSAQGFTEGLGIRPGHPPQEPYARGRFDGVTAELIWRLASPYLSPVGVAVLGEASLGPDQRAGRIRSVVQKNFRDDTVILAANAWLELERRPASAPAPPDPVDLTTLELDLGASWRVAPSWSVAVEYRGRSEYGGHGLSDRQYTAHFLGPTIHYGGQRWYFTLTGMRQLSASVHSPALARDRKDGRLYGARHTRWDGLRLRLGRTF